MVELEGFSERFELPNIPQGSGVCIIEDEQGRVLRWSRPAAFGVASANCWMLNAAAPAFTVPKSMTPSNRVSAFLCVGS